MQLTKKRITLIAVPVVVAIALIALAIIRPWNSASDTAAPQPTTTSTTTRATPTKTTTASATPSSAPSTAAPESSTTPAASAPAEATNTDTTTPADQPQPGTPAAGGHAPAAPVAPAPAPGAAPAPAPAPAPEPPAPVRDSCPGGDFSGNAFDGSCGTNPATVISNVQTSCTRRTEANGEVTIFGSIHWYGKMATGLVTVNGVAESNYGRDAYHATTFGVGTPAARGAQVVCTFSIDGVSYGTKTA